MFASVYLHKDMRQPTDIRQEQIKQAVLDIIYTDGLKNLSTRMLAKRIGMSEGAIFRHFSTKQDIILSIIKDVQTDFIGGLRKIATSNNSPQQRLEELLCYTIKYLTDNKGITLLLFSEASHNNDTEMKKALMQIFNSQKKLISKIVLDGIAEGIWDESIPVENVAMLYMGIPVSLNVELVLSNGQMDTSNFCNRMLQLINRMLAK
ncbi:TetR/AcrR family transcriptional regulator [Tenuifilum thalassicum]|uniref:TetR/AcrR family transcriptional regulator n=2 Tax=Tenuifilum thalassicum TaxID=2590900 RepID=A0A7D3XCM1_9BACT|nr:TetR/AcrR family transcriptional regulator [Tenuifilum thalassicum]